MVRSGDRKYIVARPPSKVISTHFSGALVLIEIMLSMLIFEACGENGESEKSERDGQRREEER